jgi:hypothetical protein
LIIFLQFSFGLYILLPARLHFYVGFKKYIAINKTHLFAKFGHSYDDVLGSIFSNSFYG